MIWLDNRSRKLIVAKSFLEGIVDDHPESWNKRKVRERLGISVWRNEKIVKEVDREKEGQQEICKEGFKKGRQEDRKEENCKESRQEESSKEKVTLIASLMSWIVSTMVR